METYIVQVLIAEIRIVVESDVEKAIDAAIRSLPYQVRESVIFERVMDIDDNIIQDWKADVGFTFERLDRELGLRGGIFQ